MSCEELNALFRQWDATCEELNDWRPVLTLSCTHEFRCHRAARAKFSLLALSRVSRLASRAAAVAIETNWLRTLS